MKEINELELPEDVRYSKDHEWAKSDGETIRIGVDDYAQDQLGDIVFVEMPEVGDKFGKDDVFGSIESVKAVADLFMPVGGEVTAINTDLEDAPELVNQSPYGDGWMIEIKVDNSSDLEDLMTKEAYLAVLQGSE
ncbi:MAG: glycine cleavage system protein GcvH [Desulfobacteraceae bacterium]|nr:glycine cleavage system protein GcvH [Desulfobacteraceae bacterium]MBC2755824.1 glycine cleavage system protein GcvH [Desulfobacteraceae bacterium]